LSYIHFLRYNVRQAMQGGAMSPFSHGDILMEEALAGVQEALRRAHAGEMLADLEAAWDAVGGAAAAPT
jgi:hypothetical protein